MCLRSRPCMTLSFPASVAINIGIDIQSTGVGSCRVHRARHNDAYRQHVTRVRIDHNRRVAELSTACHSLTVAGLMTATQQSELNS